MKTNADIIEVQKISLPLITIVTPSYNQASFLEVSIQSVLNQGYPNLEYILVDGGSTDGSVEIIKKYSKHLSCWISEPDHGQGDAIVKGFSKATGQIFNWLNSDDVLLPNALFSVAEVYQKTNADLLVGEDLHFCDTDLENPVFHFRPANYGYPNCWYFWTGKFRYHQPCTFFSRDVYEQIGGLDASLHYVMDYDLYCRILSVPQVKISYIRQPLSAFRLHDTAKTATAKPHFLREQRRVLLKHADKINLTPADLQALNRYGARCNFHNTVDALRRHNWHSALDAFTDGLQAAPGYFGAYAFRQMRAKIAQQP